MKLKRTIDYLREAKTRLDLTDYQLARILGLSHTEEINYAQGRRVMDDATAERLAGILGIKPGEIISAAHAERETRLS